MKAIITERFDKKEAKLKNRILSYQIADLIENLYDIDDIQMIPSVKRLKGAKAYRIRLGDYRLGITIEDNTVVFHSIGKRDKFYDSFP